MKITTKQAFQTLLFLGIGVFLVYMQLNTLSPEEKQQAFNSLQQANLFWISIGVLIAIASHVLRALRWKLLLQSAGETVKASNSFYAVMIGYLANGFLPRVGELIRCGALARKENLSFEKTVGTVLVERLFDLVVLLFIVGFSFLLQYQLLYDLIYTQLIEPLQNQYSSRQLINLLLGAFLLLCIAGFAIYHAGKFLRKNTSFSNKWNSVKHNFMDGFQALLKLQNKTLFFAYTGAMWFCYFFVAFVLFKSIPAASHLGLDASLSVLTAGSLALVIPTPGGLGFYHQFVSNTLQLYDVSEVIGFSLSWLIWGVSFAVMLLLGLLSLLLISFKSK